MDFKKIKGYNFLDFVSNRCRFLTADISQVCLDCGVKTETYSIADGQNMLNFKYNWRGYDFFVVLQKPHIVKPDRGMPYYLIPYTALEADNDFEEIHKIDTVGDFISLFYPAPTDINIKVFVNGKSKAMKDLGEDFDTVMAMPLKNVEFLKTAIRINT